MKKFLNWDKRTININKISKYVLWVLKFIGIAWLIVDAIWTIINMYNYYFGKTDTLVNQPYLFMLICFGAPIILALFYIVFFKKDELLKEHQNSENENLETIQYYRDIIEETVNNLNEDQINKSIEKAKQNNEWEKVIKLSKLGSRLFLMLNRIDLRKKCGDYIIEASKEKGDEINQAIGEVDCIGWSLVLENQIEEAKKHINDGLKLIQNINNEEASIVKCKAYRHLIGIELKGQSNFTTVTSLVNNFEKALKKVKGRNKRILKASLDVINGEIAANEDNNEKAKQYFESALKKYEKCRNIERAVKVFNKLGIINAKMNQEKFALHNYVCGYWVSEKLSRIDERKKNLEKICEYINLSRVDAQKTEKINKYFKELSQTPQIINVFEKYDITVHMKYISNPDYYLQQK